MKTLRQPFYWVGSKCRIRRNIYNIFDKIPRLLYVEPFGGSGAVFFGKEPEQSVYNDCNTLLTNFFKVIRSDYNREILQYLAEVTPCNERYFYEFRALCLKVLHGETIDDELVKLNLSEYGITVALAFAFFYVQNNGFGGKCCGNYGYSYALRKKGDRFLPLTYQRNADLLEQFANKLSLTQVICCDWRDVLNDYDAATTLFYIDPPYETKASESYRLQWSSDDTGALVARLLELKASFVLSCYDGDIYAPLSAICEKQQWKSAASLARYRDGNGARLETVYIKNNAKSGERLF